MQLPSQPPYAIAGYGPDTPFAGRSAESQLFATALLNHVAACDAGSVDSRSFRNMVVFFGLGGIGKSEFSKRCERWLVAGKSPAVWGAAPVVPRLATARWELHDSMGNIDVIPLLLSVRTALHRVQPSWPAFDLAFAAYLTSVRPHESAAWLNGEGTRFVGGLVKILSDIAEDLGQLNVVVGLTASAVRAIAQKARERIAEGRSIRISPDVLTLVDRCLNEPSQSNHMPELAANLLWQLSLEISSASPDVRPNLVIFVDHFERMQGVGSAKGERIINQLVSSLPFAFFSITGRNQIDWYKSDRSDLPVSGRTAWPTLDQRTPPESAQYEVGRLSELESQACLGELLSAADAQVSDSDVLQLAQMTNGWPLHMFAVAAVARRLRDEHPHEPIPIEKLRGPLPTVVETLLEELPDDEARVFQAACVLPFFDLDLVRAVAGAVDDGAVRRCISRTLVTANPGSVYSFRVHEEIRRVLRRSAEGVARGWSGADWVEAGERASANAKERFEQAAVAHDDQAQLMSTALGIGIAAENEVDSGWIAHALKVGPSIASLRPHIPSSDKPGIEPGAVPLIRLIETLSRPSSESTMAALAELSADPLIGKQAQQWRGYRLRYPLYRHDDAIAQFESIVETVPELAASARYQVAYTLAQARRFRDALGRMPELTTAYAANIEGDVARSHGKLESVVSQVERSGNPRLSRRYQLLLLATQTITEARLGLVALPEIERRISTARSVGHRSAERDLLRAAGYLHLFHSVQFEETIRALDDIHKSNSNPPGPVELLALRALATRRLEYAERARDRAASLKFRAANWIPTEFILESLGFPLGPIATQWTEPVEVVRSRWLGIAAQIVDRAGDLA